MASGLGTVGAVEGLEAWASWLVRLELGCPGEIVVSSMLVVGVGAITRGRRVGEMSALLLSWFWGSDVISSLILLSRSLILLAVDRAGEGEEGGDDVCSGGGVGEGVLDLPPSGSSLSAVNAVSPSFCRRNEPRRRRRRRMRAYKGRLKKVLRSLSPSSRLSWVLSSTSSSLARICERLSGFSCTLSTVSAPTAGPSIPPSPRLSLLSMLDRASPSVPSILPTLPSTTSYRATW